MQTVSSIQFDASNQDEAAIYAKFKRWVEMFSATGRGEQFTLEGYEDIYFTDDGEDGLLVFDNYSPKWASTQIDGFIQYRRIWERDVNESFPNWTITKMDVLRVEVQGNLAWSALNFWGEGKRADNSSYEGSQHSTHIWRKINGDWKMIHEHLSAPITVKGEANSEYNRHPSEPDYNA